jgi:hypothetical protein
MQMIELKQAAATQVVLQPGDAIERPGPLGTMHRGIFAGTDFSGKAWVIHNAKDQCVKWDLLEVFADGQGVSFLKRVARNAHEQNLITTRAKSLLGRKFDLLKFNCDHFVTYALAGVAKSPQLGVAAGILVFAALGIAVVSTKG